MSLLYTATGALSHTLRTEEKKLLGSAPHNVSSISCTYRNILQVGPFSGIMKSNKIGHHNWERKCTQHDQSKILECEAPDFGPDVES